MNLKVVGDVMELPKEYVIFLRNAKHLKSNVFGHKARDAQRSHVLERSSLN